MLDIIRVWVELTLQFGVLAVENRGPPLGRSEAWGLAVLLSVERYGSSVDGDGRRVTRLLS
jgi:hypothetical protein